MSADPSSARPDTTHSNRTAWIATGFASWIVGGFMLALWAIAQGHAGDVAASPYHIPVYLGFGALAAYAVVMAVQAARRGRGWRAGLPGYGALSAGIATLVLALVLDVGWREGIGIGGGIEEGLAPSRIVLAIGLLLVAIAPVRAAMVLGPGRVPRIALLVSGALALAVLSWPGGFAAATNPWMEKAAEQVGDNGELWVMDADGSHQTRLVEATDTVNLGYASWAADGSRISYTRFEVPGETFDSALASIWSVAADGSGANPLVQDGEWNWIPRWSPDGAWLAFTREAPGGPWMNAGPVGPGAGPQGGGVVGPLTIPIPHADIWRVPAGGGRAEALTDSPGDDRAPVYSPDGTRILFDSTRDGNTEIYVMNADGSVERRLTNDAGEDWGASWSPDGTLVSFNSNRSGDMEIYVMHADGSSVTQVTSDRSTYTSPTWSPDGSRIAYTARPGDDPGQIWSVNVDGSDPQNLSRAPVAGDVVWTGGWGPDGRIVFNRAMPALAEATPIVREDLGAAALLLSTAMLAAIVVVLARFPLPFGAFALVLGLGGVLAAAPSEAWRFMPAGVVAGLAVDVVLWRTPVRLRGRMAGAVAGLVSVVATATVVLATGGLGWQPTLLGGVALASGAIGWGLGALAGAPRPEASG
jgi:Tol biopolymer transport system component